MRIRTIKPEFYVSESVGRLSRNARLLFIGLWSFADDSGRGRGALPAVSGALFPYDKDALEHLDSWFRELEKEGMVRRYTAADGNAYYEVPKWLDHQRIEKPSRSKFPEFQEGSPTIPPPFREGSPLDQGSGIREQGTNGEELCRAQARRDAASRILVHLNEKAGRSFQGVEANLKPIACRLADVHDDESGILNMVDRQVAIWGHDEHMAQFLRPATLFGASKFRSYYDDRLQPAPAPSHRRNGNGDPNGAHPDRLTAAELEGVKYTIREKTRMKFSMSSEDRAETEREIANQKHRLELHAATYPNTNPVPP